MNYERHYNLLCSSRKLLQRRKDEGAYYELHHIIPRCMGGLDEASNLVLLTAREHYIAHHLLYKMYKTSQMAYAWRFMCYGSNKAKTNFITSRMHEKARMALSESKKGCTSPMLGKTHSKAAKHKMRLAKLGHKQSPQTIAKRVKHRTGKPSQRRGKHWLEAESLYSLWLLMGKPGRFTFARQTDYSPGTLNKLVDRFKSGWVPQMCKEHQNYKLDNKQNDIYPTASA